MLSYGDGAGHVIPDISSDFHEVGSELIDHCDDVSPPPPSPSLSPQLSALLLYGEGAGHDGPCAAKSSDFRDDRSELIDPCDDVPSRALLGARCDECCATVATDFGDGGSGLTEMRGCVVTAVATTIDTATGVAVLRQTQRPLQ